jgi:hypothetical protein
MHSRTELFVVDVTQRTEFELQLTYTKSAYYRLKYVVPPSPITCFSFHLHTMMSAPDTT